jgi:chromosome partitioning protein
MAAMVAFVSQKGGVGKSTLAREAAAGGLCVKVAALDTQQYLGRLAPVAAFPGH